MRLIAAQPHPEGSDDRPLIMQMFMVPHGERRISDREIDRRRFDAEVMLSQPPEEPEDDEDEPDSDDV